MIGDKGSEKTITVDGVDMQVRHPTRNCKGWISHKFKKAAVRYEVAIGITNGYIVWVNGPFPAGRYADLTIFRTGLKELLWSCAERAEADRGYRGEPNTISLPDEGIRTWRDKWQKSIARIRHEKANRRFKNWNYLSNIFLLS